MACLSETLYNLIMHTRQWTQRHTLGGFAIVPWRLNVAQNTEKSLFVSTLHYK